MLLAHIDWTHQVYAYCERGESASFWAEPLNAWSNLTFWVAAAVFARWLILTRRQRMQIPGARAVGRDLWVLNALLVGIGAGSFCLHTFAQRWAGLLDVAFIVLWVYWYLWLSARRVLAWPALVTGPALIAHLGSAFGLLALTGSFRITYLPTALAAYALAIHATYFGLPGRRWLWGSAIVFTLSLISAWLDKPLCKYFPIGTHFLWHIFNAVALWCGSMGLAKNLMRRPRAEAQSQS